VNRPDTAPVALEIAVDNAKLTLKHAAIGLRAIHDVLSAVAIARISYQRAQIDMEHDEVESDLGIDRDELIQQLESHVVALEGIVAELYPSEVQP
jgi:hypothetical protein